MKKPRVGRPADFKRRARLPVFLEARELAAVHARARAERISASTFARWAILAALGEERPMVVTAVRRPLRATPAELAKVGVKIVDAHNFLMKCTACGRSWSANLRSGGRLPRGYWQCPEGCNEP